MVLLVVLLAQMVPNSPDSPSITSGFGNTAELHKIWENLNSRCRKLPPDSPEGEAACSRRNVLGSQLGELGWCVRYMGLEIKVGDVPSDGVATVRSLLRHCARDLTEKLTTSRCGAVAHSLRGGAVVRYVASVQAFLNDSEGNCDA